MAFATKRTNIPTPIIQAVAQAQGANPNDPRAIYDVEQSMMLDPIGTIGRYFPVHLLGANVAANKATFTPQRACIPLKLHVPAAQTTVVQQLQVALEPIYTATTSEPSGNFGELALETSWLPPKLCDYGQNITFLGDGSLVSAGLWVAEISLPQVQFQGPLFRLPFNSFAVAHGTTQTLTVNTQKKFKLRRIALDIINNAHPTTVAACTTASINCGVEPQLDSADPVPLSMFDNRSLFGYMDGDLVIPGQSFTMLVKNPDGAQDVTFGGVLLGDLVP